MTQSLSSPAFGPVRRRSAIASALAPHWGALLALTLFLAGGLAVLDDYGVTIDEVTEAETAAQNFRYLAGDAPALPEIHAIYGMAFKGPLLLAERALGVAEGRGVYLSRHLLTHLFYLAGGLFAYLLAARLFGGRLLALFAMLVFLLHPRLYGHSFVNHKDIPFFAMFAVALFLAHRAFRRDTPAAFALLGVGVGVLVNLRVAGLIFFAAVPAMRALDFAFAEAREERKRILLAAGAFALAGMLTFFALLPYLWVDPIARAGRWWTLFAGHPVYPIELFRGTRYVSTDFPAEYVPVWLSITSPPFALLLGLAGGAAVLAWGYKARGGALRNTRLRFWLLTTGCIASPVAFAILFDTTLFNGWRQLYFLWAPFSLLAALGLRRLALTLGGRRLRRAAYGAAGAGAAATLVSMVLLHPNEQAHFNAFVDRVAPEHLRTQYAMDYWRNPMRQALEWLLDQRASASVNAHSLSEHRGGMIEENIAMLPRKERDRLSTSPDLEAAVLVHENARPRFINAYEGEAPPERILHRIKAYGNTIATLERKQDLRSAHERATASEPAIRSQFDLYLESDAVVYVKEPCLETDVALSRRSEYSLWLVPENSGDLAGEGETWQGFRRIYFKFPGYGAWFDGKCVASVPLPYSVAAIRASQDIHRQGRAWEGEYRVNFEEYQDVYEQVRGEEPNARAVFDVYATDDALVYVKEPCSSAETREPFFLHLIPERAGDLPEERRRHGFDNLDFELLLLWGAVFDGKCVASVPLPEYPIAGIKTGQFIRGEGQVWRAAFSTNPEFYRDAYEAAISVEPVARSAFDLHYADGALVYVKESCNPADADARFFLHIFPERARDLPRERRDAGFDNRDFDFFSNGALLDDGCVAVVPLPEYPIASIRTGQFVSGEGRIWSAEFAVGETLPASQ